MDNKKLQRWAQLLLDTGKRNNLINFKDTKATTAEVVYPDSQTFYDKCLGTTTFEVYDPKIQEDEDMDLKLITEGEASESIKKEDYINLYSSKVKKSNQVLVYSKMPNPITAIKNIDKKARSFLEETGVNVAYIAFGFVHWKEKENASQTNRAPLLLVPITIKNDSAITPYYIKTIEDDVVLNPTFNYYLQAQYKIQLPDYDGEEGLDSYLAKVNEVVSKLHWQVTSECKIGIFSFLKINMYHDIVSNSDKIMENENVKILLGEHGEPVVKEEEKDVEYVENEIIDLHTVVDADSSQVNAIEMAKTGKSFVLQGPPGTGKSQTITNIIAECLHDGKKVLFVSEKLAALNVVYEKLKQAGLEEFCLELHSYKASKKEVIDELCKTLRANGSAVSAKADAEVHAKEKLQKQLDGYARELHENIEGINKSLYQLYDAYYAFRNADDIEFIINNIASLDENYLNDAVDLLGQYEEYVDSIGSDYHKNEWYGYTGKNVSYEGKIKLKHDLETVATGLKELLPKVDVLETTYALNVNNICQLTGYIKLLKLLADSAFINGSTLNADKIGETLEVSDKLEKLSQQIILLRQGLEAVFEKDIYKLDGKDYYNKLVKLYEGFFSRLFNSGYKGIVTDIRLATKSSKKPGYSKAVEYMKSLMDYQSLMGEFQLEYKKVEDFLKNDTVTVDADWNKLKLELTGIKEHFENDLYAGNISLMNQETFDTSKTAFGNDAGSIESTVNSFSMALDDLQKDFDKELVSFDSMELVAMPKKIQGCIDSMGKVENWIGFNNLLTEIKTLNLQSYVDEAIRQEVSKEQISKVYQKLFYKHWINHVIYENPTFTKFTRIAQDKAVKNFATKDKLQFEISKAQIKAELSENRPSLDMMAGGSAVSILLREGEKKRKQKSIRKLLEETGSLIQVLKPCFLMSPLSVSTFLSENGISFDTVVFDEASQIFPQDAIGAIYRAKQLIVVGDSRQMPPSNFFNSSVEVENDEEDTDDVTDFESILDLCSTVMPQLRLKWHYRSRYEQLISFSNRNFYDGTLVTFPSATVDREGIGVDYYHVDGVFDRKSHTNRKEAEFIVDLVYENADKYPERSLGVVAFSVAQQELIEKLLAKRRKEDSSKEWFFKRDDETKEPFFVKNLETVQGDERDTIIFSIAYGVDEQGKLYHNFGPLNRVGGERRLNVAITRAKENVQLVSSMQSTDIDLNRTSALGARLLKEYLAYAQNGEIIQENVHGEITFDETEAALVESVGEFLKENGFYVDMNVGCSEFRVDIGIKKPDTQEYVLAIECDGKNYHSAKNTRDRDRLRKEILERMGWHFYRIWSTDWFKNTEVEKENLLKAVEKAIKEGPINPAESKGDSKMEKTFETQVLPKHIEFPKYEEADVKNLMEQNLKSIDIIKKVLEVEAPVAEEYLLKQICVIYGREKLTSVVKTAFDNDILEGEKLGITRRDGFLYLNNNEDIFLRVPGVKREVKYISLEELAAGLHVLLVENVTAQKDGLYKTLSNQLGYGRMTDVIEERFNQALDKLNDIVIEGDVISRKIVN